MKAGKRRADNTVRVPVRLQEEIETGQEVPDTNEVLQCNNVSMPGSKKRRRKIRPIASEVEDSGWPTDNVS